MKLSIVLVLLCLSCNVKPKKEKVCVKLMQYYEPPSRNMSQPSILIDVEVEDSVVCKKLEEGRLNGLVLYSIKKEDRNRFFYNRDKLPIRKGNKFSFVLWTSYFGADLSDIQGNKKREWESDDILRVLSGDVGLVFNKDTILVKNCTDKNIIIEIRN